MFQNQITVANIDDFMREQKRLGKKIIRWNKENYELLKELIYLNGYSIKKKIMYMGMEHRLK